MTNEEFDKLCEELLAQGMTEKDILGVILKMFEDGKIDIEGMKKLAGARGYELTEEFINKASGSAPAEGAPEGVTSEEVEDAQEVESGEESEESESEGGEESSESEESESTGSEESEEESEEDEKKKARELYDLD